MNRTSSILAVAALFASGVAVGALGMHLYYFDKLSGPPPPRPGDRMFMVPVLAERLGLSEEQELRIEEILKETRRRSGEIRGSLRPQVEQLLEETNTRILEVLTPEQRRDYERMRRFQRQRLERSFLGPGPEGPPRGRRGRFSRGPGDPPP